MGDLQGGRAAERVPVPLVVTTLPKERYKLMAIVATFDKPGDYVWHCHILSHEDNEMMRPYTVVSDFDLFA